MHRAVLLTLLAAPAALAAPFDTSVQVRLIDAGGAPVHGDHGVILRLVGDDDPLDADVICHAVDLGTVAVADGFLSIALPAVPEACVDQYLALLVDGAELGPRSRLGAVPRAAVAGRAPVSVSHHSAGAGSWTAWAIPEGGMQVTGPLSVAFTPGRASTVQACYSLTCSFGGSRTWVQLTLDGASNETGWHENDLSIAAFTINGCATWPNVSAAAHTIAVMAHDDTPSAGSCWRGKLDVDVFETAP